jgi:AcrR family transcriptional regulator
MMRMGPKTPRRHQQGEESRQRILDAVIQIAAERGYEGTTVALVSDRSGLPVSSIYWHFGKKDDLIAAVIQRSFDEWEAGLDDIPELSPDMNRREMLTAVLRHEAGSLADHPDFLRFGLMLALEERADEPRARRIFLTVRRRSLERIERGLTLFLALQGVADEAFARRAAVLTMAAVDGLFIARQADAGVDLDEHFAMLAASLELLFEERVAELQDASHEDPQGR